MPIRILVADDHGVVRGGLCALIRSEADMEVVAEAASGAEALQQAEQSGPDLVLMDVSMPGMTGIEATRQLKQRRPNVRVLILTVHEDDTLLRAAIRAGAAGYIVKRAAGRELIEAIRLVMRGETYLHPAMLRALLTDLYAPADADQPPTNDLNERELAVLRLLARGHTNRQIAGELNLSVRTIEGHRASLIRKLGISSRADLVTYAEQRGLLY